MQHKTVEELQKIAAIHPDQSCAMTETERLERWAQLLEQDAELCLSTLEGTEYQAAEVRNTMRSHHSPISVAYQDPVLRAQGLTGDSYGDAKRFFELTDLQLHDIVCHFHHGATMTAKVAAQRIRSLMRAESRPGLFARLRQAFA
jgi:hypothetical protein